MLSHVYPNRIRHETSWNECNVPQGISIECSHCGVLNTMVFRPTGIDKTLQCVSGQLTCSDCQKTINTWLMSPKSSENSQLRFWQEIWIAPPLNDKNDKSVEAPSEVDEDFRKDYKEAALTLRISPRASAALSRYCLQKLLRSKANVKPGNLINEIKEVVGSGKLPSYLSEAIDAIRNIGNLAAHPSEDQQTGELIEVEAEEAEWLLEILDTLFDFYFVQPKKLSQRKEKLNQKLESTGKPLMK